MSIQTINENDYIKDSREVINSNFTELDTNKAPLDSPALTGTPTAPTPNPGDDTTKVATTEYVQEELRQHASMPIGHEYFSMNPNIPQGSLPLFGGEYSRTTYSDLWAWVQDQTGYCKTEAEWQTLSTANNGNVPYYSDGDGSTTFRVPSLRCWVKGANGTVTEVGSYLAAGLPNITGLASPFLTGDTGAYVTGHTGAFTARFTSTVGYGTVGSTATNTGGLNFDASRSSTIYGNSTTVQPPSIVGMWLVKAYGTIEDTGVIDEQQYIDDRFAALDTAFLDKILTNLQRTDALPAGTSFPSTTVLSKMISNMMGEDGVQYYSSPGSDNVWYVKLGAKYGGLIIQGGRKYIPVTTNWTEIVLPITFSTDAISCAAVMGVTGGYVNMYFSGRGKVSYKALNGSWTSEPMQYIAIGF